VGNSDKRGGTHQRGGGRPIPEQGSHRLHLAPSISYQIS
jgi:hypothetical protein